MVKDKYENFMSKISSMFLTMYYILQQNRRPSYIIKIYEGIIINSWPRPPSINKNKCGCYGY